MQKAVSPINTTTSINNTKNNNDSQLDTERTLNQITDPTPESSPVQTVDDSVSIIGILYAILSAVGFSFMGFFVKYIYRTNESISTFHILYLQQLGGMLIHYLVGKYFGILVISVDQKYRKVILLRASIGYFGTLGYQLAMKLMPFYTANCLFFTIPIWSSFMAYFILQESITIFDILALISTFAGVIIINDPFKIISFQSIEVYTDYEIFIGTVFALIGAVAGAAVSVLVRKLKHLHFTYSAFWFSLGGVLYSPVFLVIMNK